LIAAGETSASAADVLGLSESTVRTHVEKMLTKLDVSNRAALVARGFRLGYLA
jgi:DNA-binding CsgD family transcriptional regulator